MLTSSHISFLFEWFLGVVLIHLQSALNSSKVLILRF